MRKKKNFKLDAATIELLQSATTELGISETAIVELGIRELLMRTLGRHRQAEAAERRAGQERSGKNFKLAEETVELLRSASVELERSEVAIVELGIWELLSKTLRRHRVLPAGRKASRRRGRGA